MIFIKKQVMCAVSNANYDGEVRFSPHSKIPLEPLKNEGLGDHLRFL